MSSFPGYPERVTRWQIVLLMLVCILAGRTAGASNKKTATFNAPADQVFSAAVKTAQANWQITVLDRETETLEFISHDRGTIGMGYSAVFEDSTQRRRRQGDSRMA